MEQLVLECHAAYDALGEVHYGVSEQERKSIQFRRSLYVVADMKKGEKLTAKNLRSIRPGMGLPPKYYDILLGKRVTCDVSRGTAFTWELLE